MIVLDASVLIAHLDDDDTHHDRATGLLLDAGDVALGSSPITLAEVLVGPARLDRLAQASAALARIGIEAIPMNDDAPEALARLRASTGLRLPDCCVLLAASKRGGPVATLDERLARCARALGLEVLS